ERVASARSDPDEREPGEEIQLGRATRADLMAGGAIQLGTASDDYAPCTKNGHNCVNDIYAVSLPSEIPSSHITWFQGQETCANAGKRLPTSAGGAPACRRVGPPPEMVGR